jgi:hypothetical protein
MYQAALLLGLVILALLVGCAQATPAAKPDVEASTCAIVHAGKVKLADGKSYPAMHLLCSEGWR